MLFDVLCFRGLLLTTNLDLNRKLQMEILFFLECFLDDSVKKDRLSHCLRTQRYSHSNKVQVRFNAFTMLHHLLQMIGVEKVIVFLAILFSCFRLEKK